MEGENYRKDSKGRGKQKVGRKRISKRRILEDKEEKKGWGRSIMRIIRQTSRNVVGRMRSARKRL
jgi:hypothetical protein